MKNENRIGILDLDISNVESLKSAVNFLGFNSQIIKVNDNIEQFEKIVIQIKKLSENHKNPLVVIVGGTTASAISYELNMSNITCYDFGQFNRLYKKYLQKTKKC